MFVEFEQILPVKKTQDYSISISEEMCELAETAERHKKRMKFWTEFIAICKEKENLFSHAKPTKINWINKGLGMGLDISCSITNTSAQVQIGIGSKDKDVNKKIFDMLFSQRETIENEFGKELEWDRMNDHKSSKIRFKLLDIDTYNNDRQKAIDFLLDNFAKLERVARKSIAELNTASQIVKL